MSFTNYLEDENDKPYFTTNSLAYYYDKMEGFSKAVDESSKALNLTKEEVEKRITFYIEQNKNELDQRLAQWDGKLETFDGSVEKLLAEWVDDGTLMDVIDSTLIDQKIAPVTAKLEDTDAEINKTKKLEEFTRISEVEPVRIATFDGTNEPVHPSVVYLPSGWGTTNTKYWMALTPWPVKTVNSRNDRYECPSIYTSYNGIDWFTHSSAPNPLVNLTQAQIDNGDYYSDPSIVMNGTRMEVWYRWTNGANFNETNIYRVTSLDGIAWTAPELVLNALRTDSGITGTMRAQQVFYDGIKYKSIYGVLGGAGGMQYAESTNPLSGVWSNVQTVTFKNAPIDFDPWHTGIHLVDGVYHMVAYDKRKALDYFTSTDGITFEFVTTIASTNGEIISSFTDFYQSHPIKIDGFWYLFATGTLKRGRSSTRRDLVIYGGQTLADLKPIQAGGINRTLYFNETPVLNNSQGAEAVQDLVYATYKDTYANRITGYGMAFGTTVLNNAPVFMSDTKKSPIVFVYETTVDAAGIPPHIGMMWRNTNTGKMWISTGETASTDWKVIRLEGDMIKNPQRTDVPVSTSINVTGLYRALLRAGTGSVVSNMTGVVDGQEIVIMNFTNSPVTLKHKVGGAGQMFFTDQVDKVLPHESAISFISLSTNWYEK